MREAGPRKLPLTQPAMLVATFGGVGLARKAPGTMGSLAALPFAWLIARWGGDATLFAASWLVFAVGWWAAAQVTPALGKDPGEVVIDEVAGQWLTLAAVPLDPWFFAAGFALFRLFDIWKPFPIGLADRRIEGGFGVMFDDTLAAIYAAILLLIGRHLLGR